MTERESLATVQRSLADPSIEYPLRPPITTGCPETSTDEIQYPLEVDYAYDDVDPELFEEPPAAGVERWQPLLPPLAEETALGEGNTPLIELPGLADRLGYEGALYLKDESRNPTWSHKDRLNRCTIGAAVDSKDRGVVASSSGNHGASAAAYAARAGLPCVVFTAPDTAQAVQAFLAAYSAAVVRVEGVEAREEAVDRLADDHGFHAVSSRTPVHTGHPFGPEGYKTIAYELFLELGTAPGTLFVPTGFAELLYGVWKGFRELAELGIAAGTPRMVACEPAARAPLAEAIERGEEIASVEANPTPADAIEVTTSSYRGLRAIEESSGYASPVSTETLVEGQELLAGRGFWQEISGAAGVAGLRAALRRGDHIDSPVVCLGTSSGFKDGDRRSAPETGTEWDDVRETLVSEYGLKL